MHREILASTLVNNLPTVSQIWDIFHRGTIMKQTFPHTILKNLTVNHSCRSSSPPPPIQPFTFPKIYTDLRDEPNSVEIFTPCYICYFELLVSDMYVKTCTLGHILLLLIEQRLTKNSNPSFKIQKLWYDLADNNVFKDNIPIFLRVEVVLFWVVMIVVLAVHRLPRTSPLLFAWVSSSPVRRKYMFGRISMMAHHNIKVHVHSH